MSAKLRSLGALLFVGTVLLPITLARGQDAYVTDQGDDTVTIFDTLELTDTVTGPAGNDPHEGVASLDARYVFFSNVAESTISVFDTLSRSELDLDGDPSNGMTRLGVGSRPHGLAVTPDNRYLFVTHDGSNDVYVVDIATLQVVSTVDDVGHSPHMIAISPSGREAWIGNSVGGNVSIVDVPKAISDPTNAVICVTPGGTGDECRIPTGIVTEGVAFTPDGKTVYAASAGSFQVTAIDVASRTVVAQIPIEGGPRRVVVRPNGKRAYVSQLDGFDVSVIRTSDHQLLRTATIANVPSGLGMGFNAGGSRLHVTNFDWSRETIVNLVDTSIRDFVNTGSYPGSVTILPEEVIGVRFAADATRLTWARNYLADGYHVYRGDVSLLPDYGACVDATDPDLSDLNFDDSQNPPHGHAFFYLVATDHDARGGILGRATSGGLRLPAVPCPIL